MPDTLRALVLDSAYPRDGESPWYGEPDPDRQPGAGARLPPLPECSGDAGARLELLVELPAATRRGVEALLGASGGATYGTPESYLRDRPRRA